jgi:hypothetical protein
VVRAIAFVVAAGSLSLPALASAQTPAPSASPTPPPEQDPDPDAVDEIDVLHDDRGDQLDEELRRQQAEAERQLAMRDMMRPVYLVPSVGMGGWAGEKQHGRYGGVHLWFGALIHPVPRSVGPFMGMGLALDGGISEHRDDAWYGTLEARYGLAILDDDRPKYVEATFPVLTAYAIYGWRPHPRSGGIQRVGAGLSSPLLMGAIIEEICIPIPTTLEVVVDAPDAKFSSDDAVTSVRVAFQF